MFLQLAIIDNTAGLSAVGDQLATPAFPTIGLSIIIPFVLISGGIAALFLIRSFVRHKNQHLGSFKQVVLLVTVPKERKEDSQKGGATESLSIQKVREEIAVMETLFANIGGLRPQHGIKTWLLGRDDNFSFEMVAHGGLIYFYVAVPRTLQSFIEEQIHAQFPAAVIEETKDYNIFTPTGAILAGYLSFKRSSPFPIKTYKKIDSDPLNAITNSLAKIQIPDGSCIQFVVQPAGSSWRKHGIELAREIQQGGKFEKIANRGVLGTFLHHYVFLSTRKDGTKGSHEPYRLSPMEEEVVKGLEEKASRAGLHVNIRIVVAATDKIRARQTFDQVASAFAQFNSYHYGNSFSVLIPSGQNHIVQDFIYRSLNEHRSLLLNTEEISSLYHFPLPTTETPNIKWLTARKAPPPNNVPREGIILGYNDYRGIRTDIRVARDDRARHMYIIGKSGTGKSVFQENLAAQDIANGDGVCIIDPHGDLVDDVLSHVPASRADDVILFDPADIGRPQGLNLMEYDPRYPEQKTFVINEMIKIFDKLYDLKSTGGPMFEQYMRNAMLLLMEDPESGSTLMEVPKLLADEDFRRFKLSKCHNPVVYDFWVKEAQKAGGEASLQNMVPYITSKLTQFVSNDYMRPIIGQQTSAFNFREVMDKRKILLVKLSKV
ncbi:MAG: type IV secretion system DNA-binding domain-containing protein, partial [Candidatus Magasanikbacteria bacterium]|nr:type IV secretion system DNA-binding domain-containing protein [Candidatus Magasanikbacteria bacterium]